jgi:hypothetical protein
MEEAGGDEHGGSEGMFSVVCPPTGDGHGRTTCGPTQGF